MKAYVFTDKKKARKSEKEFIKEYTKNKESYSISQFIEKLKKI